MVLLSLVVEPNRLRWDYQAGTLTVHYSKPPALLAEVGVGWVEEGVGLSLQRSLHVCSTHQRQIVALCACQQHHLHCALCPISNPLMV